MILLDTPDGGAHGRSRTVRSRDSYGGDFLLQDEFLLDLDEDNVDNDNEDKPYVYFQPSICDHEHIGHLLYPDAAPFLVSPVCH